MPVTDRVSPLVRSFHTTNIVHVCEAVHTHPELKNTWGELSSCLLLRRGISDLFLF